MRVVYVLTAFINNPTDRNKNQKLTKPAKNECLAVRMYDVHKLGVRLVKSRTRMLWLEQRTSWVQACDSAETRQLGPCKTCNMGPQTETYHVDRRHAKALMLFQS